MSRPSRRIGDRYVLGPDVASGGMATVHLGKQLGAEGFSRVVALKRLHQALAASADVVDGFLAEAKVAARIRHANVVGIQDVVREGEELFLVMDYVPGVSLSHLLTASRADADADAAPRGLPPEIACAVLLGVLDGLDAAHAAKAEDGTSLHLVHRDVSPQNVLLGTDGVGRLIDFGVARSVARLRTTQEGLVKGKLHYLPPEVVEGEPHTVAGDVYSAGCVLWEALVGRTAFAAESEGATAARILMGELKSPRASGAPISAELDEVVMRALAHSPRSRFASAGELAAALRKAAPAASAAEVRAYLARHAGAIIDERAALLARFEREPIPASGTAVVTPTPVPRAAVTASPPADDAAPTEKRGPTKFSVAAMFVALAVVAFVAARTLHGAPVAAELPVASASASAPAPPPGASNVVLTSPTPAALDASDAPGEIVRPTDSGAAVADAGKAAPGPATPTSARHGGEAAVDCRVPYRLDAEGNRIYKRECLR